MLRDKEWQREFDRLTEELDNLPKANPAENPYSVSARVAKEARLLLQQDLMLLSPEDRADFQKTSDLQIRSDIGQAIENATNAHVIALIISTRTLPRIERDIKAIKWCVFTCLGLLCWVIFRWQIL